MNTFIWIYWCQAIILCLHLKNSLNQITGSNVINTAELFPEGVYFSTKLLSPIWLLTLGIISQLKFFQKYNFSNLLSNKIISDYLILYFISSACFLEFCIAFRNFLLMLPAHFSPGTFGFLLLA